MALHEFALHPDLVPLPSLVPGSDDSDDDSDISSLSASSILTPESGNEADEDFQKLDNVELFQVAAGMNMVQKSCREIYQPPSPQEPKKNTPAGAGVFGGGNHNWFGVEPPQVV